MIKFIFFFQFSPRNNKWISFILRNNIYRSYGYVSYGFADFFGTLKSAVVYGQRTPVPPGDSLYEHSGESLFEIGVDKFSNSKDRRPVKAVAAEISGKSTVRVVRWDDFAASSPAAVSLTAEPSHPSAPHPSGSRPLLTVVYTEGARALSRSPPCTP